MFRKEFVPVWVALIALSGMFLLGQDTWPPQCTDLDGDGYGNPSSPACAHPEADCDDFNPEVNPGAAEGPYGDPTCSDGLDNNCNGLIDMHDAGCRECSTHGECDDGNPCTDDACIEGACSHIPNTAPCDDGDACTTADTCSNGACVGGPPLDCDDGDACTSDSCDPATGCVHTPVICYDGNACTTDACDPATGCTFGSISCDDANPCTDDSCDPSSGCVHTNNTAPCDDGDACTMNDVCSGGLCSGLPLDADGDGYISAACGGTDCYDQNPNAYPGSAYWGSVDRGDGSFDYNCDGVEQKRYVQEVQCVWYPDLRCDTTEGWHPVCYDPQGGWPACGETCAWATCLWKWMGWCDPMYCGDKTQECR